MKILIHELEYAIKFLNRLKLVDFSSRMRTRFVNILSERFRQYREEYLQLVKEHSHLDDEGNPIVITQGEIQRFDIIDFEAFNVALEPLLNEEFIIEITESNKNMFKSVTNSVLNCGIEFEGNEHFHYASLCERFEDDDMGSEQ